jgi:hypothetical protein
MALRLWLLAYLGKQRDQRIKDIDNWVEDRITELDKESSMPENENDEFEEKRFRNLGKLMQVYKSEIGSGWEGVFAQTVTVNYNDFLPIRKFGRLPERNPRKC